MGDVISCLTSKQKRELLFVLSGDHGSSAPAVLELNTAYLHLPLIARFPIATGIHSCYIALQKLGLTVCPDSILPDLDVLRRAIEEAERAIRNNKSGYTSLPTGGDSDEAP